jgi:hypothetical protein
MTNDFKMIVFKQLTISIRDRPFNLKGGGGGGGGGGVMVFCFVQDFFFRQHES